MAIAHFSTHEHLQAHEEVRHASWVWGQGALGGFLAIIILTIAEVITFWIADGEPLKYLRLAASVPLQILPETVNWVQAFGAGGLTLIAGSVITGILAAYLALHSRVLHHSRRSMVLFGMIWGVAVWIAGYYILAPLFGAGWISSETNPVVQFLLHAIVFGGALGWYLDANPPFDEVA